MIFQHVCKTGSNPAESTYDLISWLLLNVLLLIKILEFSSLKLIPEKKIYFKNFKVVGCLPLKYQIIATAPVASRGAQSNNLKPNLNKVSGYFCVCTDVS